jgi:hypothetical protein
MYRTGVMAPPDLYEVPLQPGLMARGNGEVHHVSLRAFFWVVASVLGFVELSVDLFTP